MALVRALDSFATMRDGHQHVVNVGDLYDSDEELVKRHRELFTPATSVVEEATARPGERRSIRKA